MCYDGEPPRVFEQVTRVARREHKCCECHIPIRIGESYEHISGIWDGHRDHFRTCEVCVWFRERVRTHEEKEGCRGAESAPPFTELYDALHDHAGEEIGLFPLEVLK